MGSRKKIHIVILIGEKGILKLEIQNVTEQIGIRRLEIEIT